MTLGEYRVGITFNPSGNETVNKIKQQTAELIDLVETLKTPGNWGQEDNIEVMRLCALAQTHYEDAAQWAVKAATKPMRE